MSVLQFVAWATSDSLWFPALECLLVIVAIIAATKDWRRRRGGGFEKIATDGITVSVQAVVTRAPLSMAIFYGVYGAATAVLVALVTNVDAAKDHRVILVVLNVLVTAYLCLMNGWFRNWLIGWSIKLAQD